MRNIGGAVTLFVFDNDRDKAFPFEGTDTV